MAHSITARYRLAILLSALGLAACAETAALETKAASSSAAPVDTSTNTRDQFVGIYNGNSFETAMGMRLTEDGRWEWGLSVGALDMRGKGYWEEEGGVITLTSDPKPAAPEFKWLGLEKTGNDMLVRVVWENGKRFDRASVRLICKDGTVIFDQIGADGWRPEADACDKPVSLSVRQGTYEIQSQNYDLADFGAGDGTTLLLEFRPNDLGVADFTGMRGILEDGVLKLSGGKWPLEMRKMPPRVDK
ncbi:hypothetical protein ACRAQ7_04345 [Erythrobacter sp. W53]|uniref:hypothetical protein n=1 Tax=Erythrobacter sp. W53 TaxID=3425947 RepID=UPI003D768AD2